MKKLDPQNFEDLNKMLHAGMGRAILFLMNQDADYYREVILDACLHNYAYDHQVDTTRIDYLYPLIKASKKKNYFHDAILRAIQDTEDSYDAGQLLDFAVLFAREGDKQARKAIYNKLSLNNTDSPLTGDKQIIELDGITGLIFCLELIGSDSTLLKSYQDDFIIKTAEEITSIDEVRLALMKAYSENSTIAKALDNIQNYSPFWTTKEIINRRKQEIKKVSHLNISISKKTTWEEVKNYPEFSRVVFRWPNVASDLEFEKAALDLGPDADPKRLNSFLLLFRKRAFPLEPNILIRLVDHPDENVIIRVLTALEIIQHPDVRALFNRIIEQPELSYRAIGLLRSNHQAGDYKIIMMLLDNEKDKHNLHILCNKINHTYQDNPIPEGIEPLTMAYEKNPCSSCRHTCIKTIQAIGEVPGWMIEECKYDSDSETRKLAECLQKNIR